MARPINDMRIYHFATRMQVIENMVRSRIESGGPLSAQEIVEGVRLTHEDFLELARLAMPAMNEIIRKQVENAVPTSS